MNLESQTLLHRNKAISVTELNRQVKKLLEASYNPVWVEGEISSFSRPSSGHWYFSLKDQKSQLRCAMFKGFNQRLKFQPKEGDKLIAKGKLSLYEGRGDYQMIVESLEPAGLGQLQAAFEALKLKLSQEGLFDPTYKKPLPKMPRKIGVITSETGAVVHDIMTVCAKRFPLIPLVVIPVKVQGEGAASEIAAAIEKANRRNTADVLIVGRGGGSLEDLWAFNEEIVARAIFASKIPIISAVGHEVDVTIADWVADYRAPTPSAAAESITPDAMDLTQSLDVLESRLKLLVKQTLETQKIRTNELKNRLKTPLQLLEQKSSILDALYWRLVQKCQLNLQKKSQQLARLNLAPYEPSKAIVELNSRLTRCEQKLKQLQTERLTSLQHRLSLNAEKLHIASPLATLGRGYAIAQKSNKQIVRGPDDVEKGENITIRVEKGDISCKVD